MQKGAFISSIQTVLKFEQPLEMFSTLRKYKLIVEYVLLHDESIETKTNE